MELKYSSVNASRKKDRYSSNINRLNISGQNIILGKNFNILKYLKVIEQKKNENEIKQRANSKPLPILNSQTPNKKITKLYNMDENNISTLNKKKSLKTDKNNEPCFITSLRNDKNLSAQKISLKFSQSNRHKRVYEINKIINSDIHLSSIIQEIKNKNKKLYNNCKTENNKDINKNNIIAYDNNNMEPILDINNILNKYKGSKDWDLKMREKNYIDFVNNNKEIKVQNVLKNIMNNEKEKIDQNFIKNEENLENLKKIIDEDEKNFNEIKKEQKKYYRLIEDNLNKLKDYNRALIYVREGIQQQINKIEYEIMKKIYEIDELRVYARFVNHIYGYETTNYEKSLIEKEGKKQVDLEVQINEVFENYKEYLNKDNNDKINNIDPDIIYNEIKLIEDRILVALRMKDKEYEDLKKYINSNETILKGIRYKEQQLEKEYNSILEEINFIVNINSQQNNEIELFIIAQDLFNYVIENFSDNNYNYNFYKEKNNKFNPFEIGGLAVKSQKMTLQKEMLVTNYIQKLSQYEEENQKIFGELINTRKDQLILEKLKAAKQRIYNSEMAERMNIERKSDKIYFIKRKMHQSIPKKKKIKIKIDPTVIKKQEDLELITYQ